MSEINYEQNGDYLIPEFEEMEVKDEEVLNSRYARLRYQYLKEHQPGQFEKLKATGKLLDDLKEADERARKIVGRTMYQHMAAEELKNKFEMYVLEGNLLGMTQELNAYQKQVEEEILNEIIYK